MTAPTGPQHWLRRSLDAIWSSIQLLGAVESGERLHERSLDEAHSETHQRKRCPTTRIMPAHG